LHIKKLLQNRGPNQSKIVKRNSIFFHATTLWHQGELMASQPLESDHIVLLFNGDLYMDEIIDGISDTTYLFNLFNEANNEEDLLDVFKKLIGPFSIILNYKSKLYFARDALGRNSLIVGRHQDQIFLTSVMEYKKDSNIKAMELPSIGVYCIDLITKDIELFPYEEISHDHNLQQIKDLQDIFKDLKISSKVFNPNKLNNEINFKFSFDEINLKSFDDLISHPEVSKAIEAFLDKLTKSVAERIKRTQKFCKDCKTLGNCNHSNVGILFSGGVDCSLLTVIAEKFINKSKSIDLMNVAFEKAKSSPEIDWNVPDRKTGLQTFDELKQLFPSRKFNFVEVNVTRVELEKHSKKLTSLVYPLENVLDESLGGALYFASRGNGAVDEVPYNSPCRVILMGSGADELFGGYTRHRNAFKRGGSELLKKELELDWIRLPSRNLARDDRVIGDNGITVRAPFVEEDFVSFARNLEPFQRCFPALDEGVGDKLLLRLCAYKLGLKNCCQFRKRALQFGSRIADSRQSAKDKSNFLQQ
jgi:asparagine synthetase B (glutamine-hydrolysing)